MNGRTERAAVSGPRLVVAEIRDAHIGRKFFPQKICCHEHVGLFDDISFLDSFVAEDHIHGRGTRFIAFEIDWLLLEVAAELFEEERLRVEGDKHRFRQLEPRP